MRLIDADALVAKLKWLQSQVSSTSAMEIAEYIDRINAQPTVDAAEVVHGQWEQGDLYDCGDVCSVCDWDCAIDDCYWSYCPNCGAKMDGGKDRDK